MEQIDHIVAGAILLVSVAQAFVDPAALKQAPRMAFFKAGATTGLVMGALVLLLWNQTGRSVREFGLFGWFGPDPALAALLAAMWPLLLLAVGAVVLGRFRTAVLSYYSGYAHLMPRSAREIPAAYGAGSLAAFGEEIAYRGFLIWYLQALAGLPVAVAASSLIFGVAHGYQARLGMIFATIAGLVLAGAYLLSGSLLLVIWMHATYNVASFTLGYRLLRGPPGSGLDRPGSPLQSEPPPNREFDS